MSSHLSRRCKAVLINSLQKGQKGSPLHSLEDKHSPKERELLHTFQREREREQQFMRHFKLPKVVPHGRRPTRTNGGWKRERKWTREQGNCESVRSFLISKSWNAEGKVKSPCPVSLQISLSGKPNTDTRRGKDGFQNMTRKGSTLTSFSFQRLGLRRKRQKSPTARIEEICHP